MELNSFHIAPLSIMVFLQEVWTLHGTFWNGYLDSTPQMFRRSSKGDPLLQLKSNQGLRRLAKDHEFADQTSSVLLVAFMKIYWKVEVWEILSFEKIINNNTTTNVNMVVVRFSMKINNVSHKACTNNYMLLRSVSLNSLPCIIHYEFVKDVRHIHPVNSKVLQVPVTHRSGVTIYYVINQTSFRARVGIGSNGGSSSWGTTWCIYRIVSSIKGFSS